MVKVSGLIADVSDKNGVIGPHEGKELELMLAHSKNVALFYSDYDIPDSFIPYLNSNVFSLKEIKVLDHNNNDFFYYIIYWPEYENEAIYLASLVKDNFKGFNPDHERKIGKILGYSSEDIEFYIDHWLSGTKD